MIDYVLYAILFARSYVSPYELVGWKEISRLRPPGLVRRRYRNHAQIESKYQVQITREMPR